MAKNIVYADNANFESEVIGSKLPIVVDFWAPWCGPCRMIAPVLEELAEDFEGEVRVAKVNVDDNPALAQRFGVQGIPTLIVVHGGQVVDTQVGFGGRRPLEQMFERASDRAGSKATA